MSTRAGSGPVLVIGGAGRTGRRVVERLRGRDRQVRVLSRRAAPAPGVDTVRGDLARLEPDVLDGVTGVVVGVEPPYDAAGAQTVLHRGVADLAQQAAVRTVPVVLVSQIYVTRPDAYPAMRDVAVARWRGEQALRAAGGPYVVVRPGWLTDEPADGVRLEQGDTGEGRVSRDAVADACVHALDLPAPRLTFEVFDARRGPADWPGLLAALPADPEPSRAR
jgi:uncharacterized protein YbjT (DUF2867 family)